MKTRSFPIVCPSCGGTGITGAPYSYTVPPPCPACKGSRVVIVTETEHDDDKEQTRFQPEVFSNQK